MMKLNAMIFAILAAIYGVNLYGQESIEHVLFEDNFEWLIPYTEYNENQSTVVTASDLSRADNTWRFATYNTHSCSPTGVPPANYDNTAKLISEINPDVIALQELVHYKNNFDADQPEELAKRTGLQYTYLPLVTTYSLSVPGNRTYGIAMMYKKTPLKIKTDDTLPGISEKRGFIAAEFDDYVFIATHLDNSSASADNRIKSYEIINEYVQSRIDANTWIGKPIYLGGDLNAINLPAIASEKWEVLSPNGVTVPGKNYRLDYILAWKGNNPQHPVVKSLIPVFGDIDASTVSDHLPVFTDIEYKTNN